MSRVTFLTTEHLADSFPIAVSEAIHFETSSFGIRTLIVDLGTFRTNFLGAGSMAVAEPSKAYEAPHIVASIIQGEHEKHGSQKGDPGKAVKIIHDAVSGKNPSLAKVLRLPLGADGWAGGIAHMDQVRSDFETCKEVAHSTDFA